MNEDFSILQPGWQRGDGRETLITREWLVTNGLGGYASGTVAGVASRRYHGLLVAALPTPLGRVVMLNHLEEHLVSERGERMRLAGDERHGDEVIFPDLSLLDGFWLDFGLPRWRYDTTRGVVLEKLVLMPYQQNSTIIVYQLVTAPAAVTLQLRPSVHFRPHEQAVSGPLPQTVIRPAGAGGWEVTTSDEFPALRLQFGGADALFRVEQSIRERLLYRIERSRGYEDEGSLWSPGEFEVTLQPGASVSLTISTESWEALRTLDADAAVAAERTRRGRLLARAGATAEDPVDAQLVLAADQFIISPRTRAGDEALLRAEGEDPRTVIAGYHWFTDWGRDTMISLDGLTLVTGRYREAGSILRTFGHYVRDGLIPNMFPEGENEGLYHTADATLWFFHALNRYITVSGDRETLRLLMPRVREIIESHLAGTRFGIGVDPSDGLLRQGAEGYQLTWMDAKVDGWVVTPRRGKAVEINALFHNALRLSAGWMRERGEEDDAVRYDAIADRLQASFNERFWMPEERRLFDVVDGESGDDPAFRPNQILAVSLAHPVLDSSRWRDVVNAVAERLVTPVGLRSLSREHSEYKPYYDGDLRTRDAAYHQGTVWGWLIGPFIDAWVKVNPGRAREARALLLGFVPHLADAGIGTISEIFDAEEPFTPRGCIAQAWSVAEVLRCWRLGGNE